MGWSQTGVPTIRRAHRRNPRLRGTSCVGQSHSSPCPSAACFRPGAITASKMAAPINPPTSGPAMYTQKPPSGPGIAMSFQPAKYATMRGPKSLAGFQPAWVIGAKRAMRAATVETDEEWCESLVR